MGRGADDQQGTASTRRGGGTNPISINPDTLPLEEAGWSREEAQSSESFALIRENIEDLVKRSEDKGYVEVRDVEATLCETIGILTDHLHDLSEYDLEMEEKSKEESEALEKKYQEASAAIYSLGVEDSYYGFSELVARIKENVQATRERNIHKDENYLPRTAGIVEEHLSMGEREISWERFQTITGIKPADSNYEYIDFDDFYFPEIFDLKDGKMYPRLEEDKAE